jgi:hypothetical protein
MTPSAPRSTHFILEAFDCDRWCPVLQALLHVDDLDALRAILDDSATGDPELRYTYHLDDADIAAIIARFDVAFDHRQLEASNLVVSLFRRRSRLDKTPYLVHTGYELPLLLEGQKKLAKMSAPYPPERFEGEDRFDHWVANGFLHWEEALEPPCDTYPGHRTVYYTPRGEEWRIPAMKLIWHASGKAGGWNEYFERLEGMLFGYEDSQNDWSINSGDGYFRGERLCCAVTQSGMTWIAAAGFRALPPIDKPALAIMSYDIERESELRALIADDPDCAAIVRFNASGRILTELKPGGADGLWHLPATQIPELNKHLKGSVVICFQREIAS